MLACFGLEAPHFYLLEAVPWALGQSDLEQVCTRELAGKFKFSIKGEVSSTSDASVKIGFQQARVLFVLLVVLVQQVMHL